MVKPVAKNTRIFIPFAQTEPMKIHWHFTMQWIVHEIIFKWFFSLSILLIFPMKILWKFIQATNKILTFKNFYYIFMGKSSSEMQLAMQLLCVLFSWHINRPNLTMLWILCHNTIYYVVSWPPWYQLITYILQIEFYLSKEVSIETQLRIHLLRSGTVSLV